MDLGRNEWNVVLRLIKSGNANIRPVSGDEEFECLVQLADEAFGAENLTKDERLSLFKKWHGTNQKIFWLLKKPGSNGLNSEKDTMGYLCALPLVEEAAERYLHGKMVSLFGFGANDICTDSNSSKVFIHSLYLRENYQDTGTNYFQLLAAFLLCIAEFTKKLADDEVNHIEVIAETFTSHGAKLLKKGGFSKHLKKSILGYDIYVLKLGQVETVGAAAETINAIRKARALVVKS